jgi:hypothetical protein
MKNGSAECAELQHKVGQSDATANMADRLCIAKHRPSLGAQAEHLDDSGPPLLEERRLRLIRANTTNPAANSNETDPGSGTAVNERLSSIRPALPTELLTTMLSTMP